MNREYSRSHRDCKLGLPPRDGCGGLRGGSAGAGVMSMEPRDVDMFWQHVDANDGSRLRRANGSMGMALICRGLPTTAPVLVFGLDGLLEGGLRAASLGPPGPR